MDTPRSDRWMALMGPLFLVLFAIALVLGGNTPSESASGQKLIEHYDGKAGVNVAAAFLIGPAVAALLLFVSWFRLLLGRQVGAPRKLLQYGAVVYAVALLVTAAVTLAETDAGGDKQASAVQAMNYLNNAMWIPIVIGAGVMLIGCGLAVRRSAVLPSWLGWVAMVVGSISLLGPGGFAGYFLAPIWVAVAGGMLYARPPSTTGAAV